jgi:hypothetical protein
LFRSTPVGGWPRLSLLSRPVAALALLVFVAVGSSAWTSGGRVMSSRWAATAALAPLVALVLLLALKGSRLRRLLLAVMLTGVLLAPSIAMALNGWRPFWGEHGCGAISGSLRPVPCKHTGRAPIASRPPKPSPGRITFTGRGSPLNGRVWLRVFDRLGLKAAPHRQSQGWPLELLVAGSLVGLVLLVGGVGLQSASIRQEGSRQRNKRRLAQGEMRRSPQPRPSGSTICV